MLWSAELKVRVRCQCELVPLRCVRSSAQAKVGIAACSVPGLAGMCVALSV